MEDSVETAPAPGCLAYAAAVTLPSPPPVQAPPRIFVNAKDRSRSLLVIGSRKPGISDLYFYLLRGSWFAVVGIVALIFLALNALFGTGFWLVGGVANASTWLDDFFFSVQTLATIGYGAMYPLGRAAEVLMTIEALVGVLLTAVVTGLCFAKFARPTSRVIWSKICVVSDRDGIPTMMFRVANERMNHIVEATIRVAVLRTEFTKEGDRSRRVVDMDLIRDSTPSFILSWTVMHPITPASPLYGLTPETFAAAQPEIVLTLTGLDETLMQTIHARNSYMPTEVQWGSRFADILGSTAADGRRIVDYTKFHDFVPAKLTAQTPEPSK